MIMKEITYLKIAEHTNSYHYCSVITIKFNKSIRFVFTRYDFEGKTWKPVICMASELQIWMQWKLGRKQSSSRSSAPRAAMLLLNYWSPCLFASSHREGSHLSATPGSLKKVQFGFNIQEVPQNCILQHTEFKQWKTHLLSKEKTGVQCANSKLVQAFWGCYLCHQQVRSFFYTLIFIKKVNKWNF